MDHRQVGIVVSRPGFPDRRLSLKPGVHRLGRAEDNELCLPDIGVSRRHARIIVDADRVVYEDLGSGNGTWFQGRRVKSQPMGDGDLLVIEPFTLRFEFEKEDTDGRTPVGGESTQRLAGVDHWTAEPAGARLERLTPSRTVKPRYDIAQAGLTLGRSEQRDVVMDDPAASRLHAEILKVGGSWWLKDAGSANGLFVNNKRVREKQLADGDIIRIGATEFRFSMLEEPARPTDVIDEDPVERTEGFADVIGPGSPAPAPAAPWGAAPAPRLAPSPTLVPEMGPPPAQPAFAPAPAGFGAPAPAGFGAPAAAPAPQPAYAAPAQPAYAAPAQPAYAAPAQPAYAAPAAQAPYAAPAPQPTFSPAPRAPASARPAGFGKANTGFGTAAQGGQKPQGGFLSRPINIASLGILLVTVLMLGGKFLVDAFSGGPSAPAAATAAAPVATTSLEPEVAQQVETLMGEGMDLFKKQKYRDSTSKFLAVLKVDPGNEDAERMAYVACEFIAIKEMRDAVESRAASDADRAKAKEEAVALANAALGGQGSLGDARDAVKGALRLNPGDADLTALDTDLGRRAGAAAKKTQEKKAAAHSANVGDIYAKAKSDLDRGRYSSAIEGFEAVKAADSSRSTAFYYDAEEGIAAAKEAMRKASEGPYRDALAAYRANDLLTARAKLNETIQLDPYNSAAKSKRDEVQKKLEAQASEKFKEARVYENANQTEKAISTYLQVQKLVGDKGSDLYQKAQGRIDALSQ